MYNYQLLSELCETVGMTHKDFAAKTKLSEATISRYLNGDVKDASLDAIVKMCDVLHVSVDLIAGREAMIELPTDEAKGFTENLIVIRDILRRNFERIRTIEHEKDAAAYQHIEDLKEQIGYLKKQLEKYSSHFKLYNRLVISLSVLCALMFGMMVFMFINNRALSSQVRDLQEHIAEIASDEQPEYFPEE